VSGSLEVFEDGAVFRYPEGHDDMVRELDHLLDYHDGGRLTRNQYVTELKGLVARHPSFIDGHAHLGFALLEQDKPKLALGAGLCGLALGEEAIPSDFDGKVEWGFLENRPFLRAAHSVVLCYLRLGQRLNAIPLMEKMLAWNPNDNQGIRFIIGSVYLRSGMPDKAVAIFHAEGPHYPPYRYELGLLLFRTGRHQAAATSLRHGFVENGYIAEILCGTPDPLPLPIWHGSNFAEAELAQDYVLRYGDLWRRSPEAVTFLRWLHMHPKIMAERGAILEWREALLWEHDVERRRMLLDCEETSLKRIDDLLSQDIVIERTDRHGRTVVPWLHSGMRP
jgi:tetratricopeptide (TPR) repeat protein